MLGASYRATARPEQIAVPGCMNRESRAGPKLVKVAQALQAHEEASEVPQAVPARVGRKRGGRRAAGDGRASSLSAGLG